MERREDKQAVAQAAPQRGKLFNKSTIFFRGELSGKEDWLSLLVGWLREVNCGGLWAGPGPMAPPKEEDNNTNQPTNQINFF